MKTTSITLATIAILAVAMSCATLLADPVNDAAVALVLGNSRSGPQPVQIVSQNGQNAFVHSTGDGSGVIFGPKGSTLVQKIGDTTFITPTFNEKACQNRNVER